MKKTITTLLLTLSLGLASAAIQAKVVGKTVSYKLDGHNFTGYVTYDDKYSGTRPGVIVVHEWWGHNDYARHRADMLAKLGYSAIALDMYGDGKQADHPKDAMKFSGAVKANMDSAEKRFMAAYNLLQQQPQTDKTKIAAIGYCFGGGIVLSMARRGVELDAVVSFHGSLSDGTTAQPGSVKARVLVLNGAADPFTKPEQIAAIKSEMKSAAPAFEFVDYPNAKHAFTNPAATALGKKFGIPIEYNKEADLASWDKMKQFLKETFR